MQSVAARQIQRRSSSAVWWRWLWWCQWRISAIMTTTTAPNSTMAPKAGRPRPVAAL
jgi:hypothetical protein